MIPAPHAARRTPAGSPATRALAWLPALVLLWVAAPPAPAAAPQDEEPAPEAHDPARGALDAGRLALDEGRLEEARQHLRQALSFRPADPELLNWMLRAVADDADLRALWSLRWYRASSDAAGRVRPSGEAKDLLAPRDSTGSQLAASRAAAVRELRSLADRSGRRDAPEGRVLEWWARRAAHDLARDTPELVEDEAPWLVVGDAFHQEVLEALEQVMESALSGGRTEEAVRAARILHGLAVQAGYQDLQGERPPSLAGVRAKAGGLLARARDRLAREVGRPWTVEELDELLEEQGEEFTRRHDDLARPGVAVSPRGWYRVETGCGFETLRGVAATVEEHHARLVDFYGLDPFVGRPGLVRVVPEAAGLESEGAPFFWAAGFQGGDTTTVRFSTGNIQGLGHTLTHELTHRFDGALFPGQPSWLTEGKAVWTGSAYGHSSEPRFVPEHANIGTIEGVWGQGWGRLGKLRDLITGDLEDYRANYTAGYALYVYLNTWCPPGEDPLFRERLQGFMEHAQEGASDREAQFVRWFCDGQGGRPADLEAFAEGYQTYLQGFYWQDRAEWVTRLYTTRTPPVGPQPWVYDEPTWVWSRVRSEPYFGDGQAEAAGELFADLGRAEEAVAADVWALAVERRLGRVEQRLRRSLRAAGEADAAWAVGQQLAFPLFPFGPEAAPDGGPAPFLSKLPKTAKHLAALAEAADEQAAAAHPATAAVLRAEHDRLARWLGLPEAGLTWPGEVAREVARPVEGAAWVDELLAGSDRDRPRELWYAEPDGDLVVGRARPREGTGTYDRRGGGVAFVRGSRYELPGTWRLRTRVRFTTAYAAGDVVIGWTRRDRHVKLRLSGGDARYASGLSEEEPTFDQVGWRLSGPYEREGALEGARPGGTHKFGRRAAAFWLEVLVDGASVTAFVDGERLGTFCTTDGAPVEGYVGFGTSSGSFTFEHPTVERLDAPRLAKVGGLAPVGLDLSTGESVMFHDLQGRPVLAAPAASQGTLLMWVPAPSRSADMPLEEFPFDGGAVERKALRLLESLGEVQARHGLTQKLVLCVPEASGEEVLANLRAAAAEAVETPVTVVTHPYLGFVPEGLEDVVDSEKRWVLFLDSAGVARVVSPAYAITGGLSADLAHWLRVFRDHGRPPRELPAPTRVEDPAADEGGEGAGGAGDPASPDDGE